MVGLEVFQYYGLSCPKGGKFYICEGSAVEFLGCCTIDPCTEKQGGVCPDDKLRYSSFSADKYNDIYQQSCERPQEGPWWTCQGAVPPFLGCCTTNPCDKAGCPDDNLRPAVLSTNTSTTYRYDFIHPKGYIPVGSSTPSSTPSATASPTPDSNVKDSEGLSTGAIAGIAVGAVLAVLIIVAGILWKGGWFPRKKKEDENKPEADVPGAAMSHMSPMTPMAQQAYPHQGHQGYGYADESGRSVMSSPSTGYIRDSYVSGVTAPGSQYGALSPALSKAGLHGQHASPELKQQGFDQKYGYNGYNGYPNNGLGLDTVSELPVTNHHHCAQELPAGNYPGFEMDAGAVQPPQVQPQQQPHVSPQEGDRQDVTQEQATQHGEERRN